MYYLDLLAPLSYLLLGPFTTFLFIGFVRNDRVGHTPRRQQNTTSLTSPLGYSTPPQLIGDAYDHFMQGISTNAHWMYVLEKDLVIDTYPFP